MNRVSCDGPIYGDIMPAYMYPEHHPDYRPYIAPKLRRSSCPGAKPFNWRTADGSKRDTLAALCTRLKNHPAARTWSGEYPDAPPTGQGPCAPAFEPDTRGCFYFFPRDSHRQRGGDAAALAAGCQCEKCNNFLRGRDEYGRKLPGKPPTQRSADA